jgi:8-oxo-dGTP diphosphatase
MTGDREHDDELAFLAAYDASQYPHPSVAVDVVLLTVADDALLTLLVRRPVQPQVGRWALPGTFVGMDESVDGAAQRALATKTGLAGVFAEQLYTFGEPGRDPRTRVISVTYFALVEAARLRAAVDARLDRDLCLATLRDGPDGSVDARGPDGAPLELAFDHGRILAAAVERIRGKLDYAALGFELLPEAFTLYELRRVHEAILGHPLNKDSFRRTVLNRELVEPTGEVARGLGHRPAALYRFALRDRESPR